MMKQFADLGAVTRERVRAEHRRKQREAYYEAHNVDDEGFHDSRGNLLHNFESWRSRRSITRKVFDLKKVAPAPVRSQPPISVRSMEESDREG